MKGTITKDPTNQNFWLVVAAEAAFGLRLKKGVAALLKKLKGDVLVEIDRGVVTVGGRHIGQIIGWNGQPIEEVNPEAAWTIRTASGRAGRLGRALQRAVESGRIKAEVALQWVERYLGKTAAQQLQELLSGDNKTNDEELLQILRQHLLKDHGEEGDLPPW